MRSRSSIVLFTVIMTAMFLGAGLSVVRAQIDPIYPENGAELWDLPSLEWTDGGCHLFGVYLYLPVFGSYLPIPLRPPAWTFLTSHTPDDPAGIEILWNYVDEDTWAPWAVLGVNLQTREWEVGGPWWFKKRLTSDCTPALITCTNDDDCPAGKTCLTTSENFDVCVRSGEGCQDEMCGDPGQVPPGTCPIVPTCCSGSCQGIQIYGAYDGQYCY